MRQLPILLVLALGLAATWHLARRPGSSSAPSLVIARQGSDGARTAGPTARLEAPVDELPEVTGHAREAPPSAREPLSDPPPRELTETERVQLAMVQTMAEQIALQQGTADHETLLALIQQHQLMLHQPPPPDGVVTELHDDGSIAASGFRRNGKRHGEWTTWYVTGERSARGSYVHGREHGLWTYWHPDGRKKSEGQMVYGARDGLWREWRRNGRLAKTEVYEGGRKEGAVRTFFATGAPESEGSCADDEKHGVWRTWVVDGTLVSEGSYHYGQYTGPWKFWGADGVLDEERSGVYENGQRVAD